MTTKSSPADPIQLLHNGVVVTGCDASEVLTSGSVTWSGERIVAVGPESELRERYPNAELLDAHGGLILPGFINLHHHLYSAFARGIALPETPTSFGQILESLWWRLDRALTPETIRLSALLGAIDCIRWGCTTLFDHHASPSCIHGSLETISASIKEAGLSASLCYEISDRNGHHEALSGFDENLEFIQNNRSNPRIRGMIGLHASFTISDATFQAIADRRSHDFGCHVHLAEDPIDAQISIEKYGAAPLERLDRWGLVDDQALLVHGIHVGSDDRNLIASRGSALVHCPESNANNGVGQLDVELVARDGCTIGLGTDGMSSSMLHELRTAVLVQRAGKKSPTAGFEFHPHLLETNARIARRVFDEPMLGKLTPGAPADICVVDAQPPTPISTSNFFGHLVYGAAEASVRHTIARGRLLLKDFCHTTLDPQEINTAARLAAPELWERFHAVDISESSWIPS